MLGLIKLVGAGLFVGALLSYGADAISIFELAGAVVIGMALAIIPNN